MPEHLPGNDPLGDRLRATFAAEHADLERRHQAQPRRLRTATPLKWMPLAAAAALIALVGFFFVASNSGDQAVELDVAGQPQEPAPAPEIPGGGVEDSTNQNSGGGAPVVAGQLDQGPAQATNFCDTRYDPERTMLWDGPDGQVPLAVEPVVGMLPELARNLPSGTEMELTGGCTVGTALAPLTGTPTAVVEVWVEVAAEPANQWVREEYLVTKDEFDQLATGQVSPQLTDGSPAPNGTSPDVGGGCENGGAQQQRFVWNIALDDPDGGLVAHSSPGIDAPVTRILTLDKVVTLTGNCEVLASGSPWFQIEPNDWVSGNFLARTVDACFTGAANGQRSAGESPDRQLIGPRDGNAIAVGDVTAFSAFESTYRLYPSENVDVGVPCILGAGASAVCAIGTFEILDLDQQPVFSSQGPVTLPLTGNRYSPPDRAGLAERLIEVVLEVGEDSDAVVGFIDPAVTALSEGRCPWTQTGPHSFDARRCAVTPATPARSSGTAGSAQSTADHVHTMSTDVRAVAGTTCTRVVIELGATTNGVDTLASTVPAIDVVKTSAGTTIRFTDCAQCSPFVREGGREVLEFGGGSAAASSDELGPRLDISHRLGTSSVTFMSNPARIVFDVVYEQ